MHLLVKVKLEDIVHQQLQQHHRLSSMVLIFVNVIVVRQAHINVHFHLLVGPMLIYVQKELVVFLVQRNIQTAV